MQQDPADPVTRPPRLPQWSILVVCGVFGFVVASLTDTMPWPQAIAVSVGGGIVLGLALLLARHLVWRNRKSDP